MIVMTESTQNSALKDVTKAFLDITESVTIPKEVIVAATEKPASELGKGLSDLIFLIFSPLEKKRIAVEADIKKYKSDIQNEMAKIPKDKRVEPRLNIVGPALEASKFHTEEEKIRIMFAKLIAASSNSDYQNYALPAFVEIVKQLSSSDAENLKALYEFTKQPNSMVSGTIRITESESSNIGRDLLADFIPFDNLNADNQNLYSASLDNLKRLGLIQIRRNYNLQNGTFQKAMLEHPVYKSAVLKHEYYMKFPEYDSKHIKIIYGIWSFTDFGEMFVKCCIKDS